MLVDRKLLPEAATDPEHPPTVVNHALVVIANNKEQLHG